MTVQSPSASALSVYDFKSIQVRVVEKDGIGWFVASDVAKALNYPQAKDMVRVLDDDERGRHVVPTPSGDLEMVIINESGLYHALIKSRKPEAKPFRKWVTSEVLPSIRKTGSYTMPQPALEPPTLTASEQQTLSEIVDLRTKDHGPAIGKAKAVVWSRVHRKFRVARYQQLPREQLADAIAYVMQMVIKTPAGEVPALPAPEPIVSRYHYPMTLWNPQNRMGKTAWLTYPEYTRPEPSTRPLMRLLTQLQQEGHEVAGARAEYDTIRHLLEVFYYRLDMLRTLFERMDSHGLNIQLH